MRAIAAAAALLVLAIAGCGGSSPHSAPATPSPARTMATAPSASPSSAGAAFCASLKAAVDPQTVYTDAVIRQDGQVSSFSTAAPADVERAARAQVAGWIAVYCPRFTYLTKD